MDTGKVVIFGLGELAEITFYFFTHESNYEVEAFTVDKEFLIKPEFMGLPVVPFEEVEDIFPPNKYMMFIAIGYNRVNNIRKEKFYKAKNKGYKLVTYIHSSSTIAKNVEIGENCFIFEDNTIQPFVKIGDNCIIWSGNHIGHHSMIEPHCFITSHVVISGGCKIGEGTFLGVNATLRDHISIGKQNVIGAGAIILKDTNDFEVYPSYPTRVSKVPSYKLRRI